MAKLANRVEELSYYMQMDGGDLSLVGVDEDNIVYLQLAGACSSCAISDSQTLDGLNRILKSEFSWISEVKGSLDQSLSPAESAALGKGAYVPQV